MSLPIAAFLSLTLTLAASLMLYLANVRFVATRATARPSTWRFVFAAPLHAWRLGARALPVAFAISVVLYGTLQLSTQWAGPW